MPEIEIVGSASGIGTLAGDLSAQYALAGNSLGKATLRSSPPRKVWMDVEGGLGEQFFVNRDGYLVPMDAFSIRDNYGDYWDEDTDQWRLGEQGGGGAEPEALLLAISDELTAITVGAAKLTVRMPFALSLTAVRASLTAPSSSGVVTVDINKNGTTILSTKLTIDQGEKTSTTAASAAVISDVSLADDDEITIDIDTAGSGATGLKVSLIGERP